MTVCVKRWYDIDFFCRKSYTCSNDANLFSFFYDLFLSPQIISRKVGHMKNYYRLENFVVNENNYQIISYYFSTF